MENNRKNIKSKKEATSIKSDEMLLSRKEAKAISKMEKKAAKKVKEAEKGAGGAFAFLMLKIVIALVLVVVIVYFGFACVVREGNAAIILRFGAPRQTVTEAGLYFKLPWPFETVVTYDNREQYLETNNDETTTMDKKNIIFKTYAIWQIDDPLVYHNSVGKYGTTESYIKDQIKNATNGVMGMYNLSDLISSSNENIKTEEIQKEIFKIVKNNCEANYGVKILDVSVLRIAYPDTNRESIFANISAERQAVISKILEDANAQAANIISAADAEAAQIVGEGEKLAAEKRAQTEKDVAKIYSEAQEANLELFRFLKELDTIVNSVNENSVLVVDSNAYPFNILLEYGKTVDENTKVIEELEVILAELPEKDRTALVEAMTKLMQESKNGAAATTQSGTEGN